MKKVLFATTALIATASVAAAEVRISGYGRFGLAYNSANSTDATDPRYNGLSETNITSRLRLQFDMSAETDAGVAFDARVRMQSENRDGNPGRSASAGVAPRANNRDNGFNGARFGVSYQGFRVNVGNIIGAVENMPGLYTTGTRSAGTGIDGMGFHSVVLKGPNGTAFNWDAYDSDGMGNNGVELIYSTGGFTGHLSYSEVNGALAGGVHVDGESRTGVMLSYSFGDYYVAAAYQSSSNGPTMVVGGRTYEANDGLYALAVGGDFGAFGARLAYGSTDVADSITLEGNMDIGAASNILVWVNSTDVDSNLTAAGTGTGIGGADGTAFGLNYQYDLGGGATFVAGYVNEADNDDQFQAGVYFSF